MPLAHPGTSQDRNEPPPAVPGTSQDGGAPPQTGQSMPQDGNVPMSTMPVSGTTVQQSSEELQYALLGHTWGAGKLQSLFVHKEG